MRHLIVSAAIGVALPVACGGTTTLPQGDASTDASHLDAPGLHYDSGGVCNPNAPALPQQQPCDATLDAYCEEWAQSVAIGAYGWSRCGMNTVTGATGCMAPDCGGGCCGGVACGLGEVCASDTPDGPHYCLQACKGL